VSQAAPASFAYQYASPSELRRDASGRGVLALATSGGVTETGPALRPYFFTGFLAEPGPAAQALLATAAIARAQYHVAASTVRILRDPVVTSNTDRLRFESFSVCCGVHARLDLPPEALSSVPLTSGTTNVDFNAPMRGALATAAATAGQILLKVGDDEVTAVTETATVTERKVELPSRWVKGFGEVSGVHPTMSLVAELTGPDAKRFIAGLPRGARNPLWAVPVGGPGPGGAPAARALSLSASPRPGAACLAAPERLAELRPLLRFARGLRVYAPPTDFASLPAASAWELTLGTIANARFTLTLSPDRYRGFTGEGALLGDLADGATAADDADLVTLLLGWDPVIDLSRLTAAAGLSTQRVRASLALLATSGNVGYDLAEGAYFHRELPLGANVERVHPRLADARQLVATGQVSLVDGGAMSGEHRVTFGVTAAAGQPGHDSCTCPWWGKHQGTRGPCKHVLAARMALAGCAR
jgi:hypothetical protein